MRTLAGTLGPLALVAGLAGCECGDTTGEGGTRVACACGDMVTTDTRLEAGDPVVDAGCMGDALLIGANDVTLDCDGLTLRGDGLGADTGITLAGLSRVTVKDCHVDTSGYGIGLFGSDDNEIERNVLMSSIVGDGNRNDIEKNVLTDGEVSLTGDENRIERNELTSSTAPNISVEGLGNRVRKNQISVTSTGQPVEYGIVLTGDGNKAERNAVSGTAGIRADGLGNEIEDNRVDLGNVTSDTPAAGILANGDGARVKNNEVAIGETGDPRGISVEGDDAYVKSNEVTLSGVPGFGTFDGMKLSGAGSKVADNDVRGGGITLEGANYEVKDNSVSGATASLAGGFVANLLDSILEDNRAEGGATNGFFVVEDSAGITLRDNEARGNTGYGFVDGSGGGTLPSANTYVDNKCDKNDMGNSDPQGLCNKPKRSSAVKAELEQKQDGLDVHVRVEARGLSPIEEYTASFYPDTVNDCGTGPALEMLSAFADERGKLKISGVLSNRDPDDFGSVSITGSLETEPIVCLQDLLVVVEIADGKGDDDDD